MQVFFWIALAIVIYTYVGYGLLLLLVNRLFRRKKMLPAGDLPAITFIVPAYNEAEVIRAKIENTLSLNYPPDRIRYLFITDGSNDGTAEIVANFSTIKHLHQPERQGKSAAINRAMQHVTTPVVVFSDANTFVNKEGLLRLVEHFADKTIGGVSGEKQIATSATSSVGTGERMYWQYESLLKQANAEFYTIIGAAGELFGIRTALYKPLADDVILDDFFISATVCLQRYRFGYEKEAVAVETSSSNIDEEQKRKVRISAGCYQAFIRLHNLLNPFQNGKVAFQYVSHRVLRWVVCPLLLPVIFLVNCWLYLVDDSLLYKLLFWAQCCFYCMALMGHYLTAGRPLPFLLIPSYFLFMVSAQYRGFIRFVTGKQLAVWEKASRDKLPISAAPNRSEPPMGNQ